MSPDSFIETTSSVARRAGVLAETVRLYGKLGLIDFLTLPNGTKLYQASTADRVKEIYRERMARRGGRRTAHRAA